VAYDEELAARIREMLEFEPDVEEKRMFGGLAFLLSGNMAVAASGKGGLMVRVDPAETDAIVAETHAQPFEMKGRPVDGWVRVDAEGVAGDPELREWVERGVGYARTLPAKG
jgi:TfoX/Sxy family transcriptional regulator of competence genes